MHHTELGLQCRQFLKCIQRLVDAAKVAQCARLDQQQIAIFGIFGQQRAGGWQCLAVAPARLRLPQGTHLPLQRR